MLSETSYKKTVSIAQYGIVGLFTILGAVAVVSGGLAVFDVEPVSPAQAQQQIEISNWTEFNTTVRNNPNGDYVLVNDLNESTPGYSQVAGPNANGGDGFLPIGEFNTSLSTSAAPFNGTFDGQGHTIRDFVIDRPSETSAGLFGLIGSSGSVESVSVTNATVDGDIYAGSLIGYTFGTVSDVTADGSINGSTFVGGVIGVNDGGTVTDSQASATVTGGQYIGGLVGGSTGTIMNSQASGGVTGNEYVGGLAGAIGVSGETTDPAVEPNITSSSASGTVTGDEYVGGLVGGNGIGPEGELSGGIPGGEISQSSASGAVTTTQSSGAEAIGGLVGESFAGSIIDSHATGDVTAPNASDVGGLAGYTGVVLPPGQESPSKVDGSYATGQVEGDTNVGGLIGRTLGDTVTDSYAQGDVMGSTAVGGLIGSNQGGGSLRVATVSNSYATGNVDGQTDTGGLIGENINDDVINSYTLGDVSGDTNTGGLIGRNTETILLEEGRTITRSFAAGDVDGTQNTGGLIGANLGDTIQFTYALGDVSGGSNTGGLVGSDDGGVINRSYAVGTVSGSQATGGLVGANVSTTVSGSYWDTETTGQMSSAGNATGLPSNQMRGVTPTNAGSNTMAAFAFSRDTDDGRWIAVVEGEQINPTPAVDCYPILNALDASTQLDAQGCTEQELGLGEFEVVTITDQTPSEVGLNDSFTVQYTVENVGENTARQAVRLELNGEQVATKPDTLTPGQAVTNSFTEVTLPDDASPGDTVSLTVRTNDDAETVELNVTNSGGPPAIADYATEQNVVTISGVSDAIGDWQSGDINIRLVSDVITAWQSGTPVS